MLILIPVGSIAVGIALLVMMSWARPSDVRQGLRGVLTGRSAPWEVRLAVAFIALPVGVVAAWGLATT